MSKKFLGRLLPRHQLSNLLLELQSPRKPARVVTPGGIAPRGNPSSWKCRDPRFQSLVEEDCQRVLEIARSVSAYETHSVTLDIGSPDDPLRYTPDLIVWSGDLGAVIEVKPERKLSCAKTAIRLRRVIAGLHQRGIPLCLLMDTDARADGLQTELKKLQRERPARGHFRADIDPNCWDPLSRTEPTIDQLERWNAAQKTCDELLSRVMRRDPDGLIPTVYR